MKIKELTKFDKALKREFCNYLKKYFKEDCKANWLFDDRISIDIDFKVVDEKEPIHLIITDRRNYRISLNELGSNIDILDFKKYIDKLPYYFGNFDVFIDYNKFKSIEQEFIDYSEKNIKNQKIDNYFSELFGEKYENSRSR